MWKILGMYDSSSTNNLVQMVVISTTYHNNLKMSSFEALYGYQPRTISIFGSEFTVVQASSNVLQERLKALDLIRDNLQQAQ